MYLRISKAHERFTIKSITSPNLALEKRNVRMDAEKYRYFTGKKAVVFAALSMVIILAVFAFFGSYRSLRETIAMERESYLSELTNQMSIKVSTAIYQKQDEVFNYANLINQLKPQTFAELRQAFAHIKEQSKEDRILLVSQTGTVYMLDGNSVRIYDRDFLAELVNTGSSISAFSPLGTAGDFWLFGTGIDKIRVENIPMVAVVRAGSNKLIADDMTTVMFNRQAVSYLLSDRMEILVSPSEVTSYGTNLLTSLTKQGMSEDVGDKVQYAVEHGEKSSSFFTTEKGQYLIQTTPVESGYTVAVVMNMDIAISDTVKAMNQTMLFVAALLIVTLVSAFSALFAALRGRVISERQEAQYQMQLVKKAADNKSDFLSKMSHDIRTPLNGIIGMVYLARENMDNREELEDDLAKVQASADYLLSLVNDILDMSKIENGKLHLNLEPANAEDLVDHAVGMFSRQAAEKNIHIQVNKEGIFPYSYMLDNLRMKQILVNLISNAMKFTDFDGHINLTVKRQALDESRDQVIFQVADDGCGMTEEFMNRIGTPFEQETAGTARKHGGSGLGLSIVKSLVNMMGGELKIDSKVNEGSCFLITIPLARVKKIEGPVREAVKEQAQTTAEALLEKKRILLVEDHPINAQIAMRLLSKWGMDVILAEDGRLGLQAFEESEEGYYDLIFMDIQMPVMNGYEATQAIRALDRADAKRIPIYAMSANAFEDDVKKSQESGMNGHIRKPLNIAELKELLKQLL